MKKINKNDILSIVAKNLKINKKKINENTKFDNFESWDSLAQIRIILEIENKYKIKFNLSKIIDLKSVNLIIKNIK